MMMMSPRGVAVPQDARWLCRQDEQLALVTQKQWLTQRHWHDQYMLFQHVEPFVLCGI
jgi:hypothetical protein